MGNRRLAFRIPLLLALLVLAGGCYTLISHPNRELSMAKPGQGYEDCASCHQPGAFEQPLVSDPYGYATASYWSYYGCPWWLPDCGFGYGFGNPGTGGLLYGRGGARAVAERKAVEKEGRSIGGRGDSGGAVELPATGAGPSSPAARTAPETGSGQQPGRTMKQLPPAPESGQGKSEDGKSEKSKPTPDPKKKDAPAKDTPEEHKP